MHLFFRDHTYLRPDRFCLFRNASSGSGHHLIQNIKDAAQPVLELGRDAVVSVILDGENAWEYYPQSGREFLRRFFDRLSKDSG